MDSPHRLLDRLPSAIGGAMTQSTEQHNSSVINRLAALMKQAKANYPTIEISPETATVWLDQWAEIVRDYHVDLFTRALRRCFRVMKFFPLPVDIETELKAILRDERKKRSAESAWKRCEACNCQASEDGWVRSTDGVLRAKCWNDAQANRKSRENQRGGMGGKSLALFKRRPLRRDFFASPKSEISSLDLPQQVHLKTCRVSTPFQAKNAPTNDASPESI
jgi:hypothetical protein